jgi:hypothetical protein
MGKHHKPDHLSRAELELRIRELSVNIEEHKVKKEIAALRARMADLVYANSEPVAADSPLIDTNYDWITQV